MKRGFRGRAARPNYSSLTTYNGSIGKRSMFWCACDCATMQTRKQWSVLSGEICDMYTMLNLQCCKCTRIRFHGANGLVVLRSCAPKREHWPYRYSKYAKQHQPMLKKLKIIYQFTQRRQAFLMPNNVLYCQHH